MVEMLLKRMLVAIQQSCQIAPVRQIRRSNNPKQAPSAVVEKRPLQIAMATQRMYRRGVRTERAPRLALPAFATFNVRIQLKKFTK